MGCLKQSKGGVATAAATYEPALYSIFSNHPCPDSDPNLDFPGSGITITGSMHSNCNLKVSVSNNAFDGIATYVGDDDMSGSGNFCNGGPCFPIGAGTVPINYVWAYLEADCTYTGVTDLASEPSYWADFSTKEQLKPGHRSGDYYV